MEAKIFKKLNKKFEKLEPIFEEELIQTLNEKEIAFLNKKIIPEKKINKLEDAFVMPKRSEILNIEIPFDITAYIIKKYIVKNKETFGIFSGLNSMNILGFSTQVPIVYFIKSNIVEKEEIKFIGKIKVYLSKPKAKITNNNYKIIQLLETLEEYGDDFRNNEKLKLKKLLKQKEYTNIKKYLIFYNLKVEELINEVETSEYEYERKY